MKVPGFPAVCGELGQVSMRLVNTDTAVPAAAKASTSMSPQSARVKGYFRAAPFCHKATRSWRTGAMGNTAVSTGGSSRFLGTGTLGAACGQRRGARPGCLTRSGDLRPTGSVSPQLTSLPHAVSLRSSRGLNELMCLKLGVYIWGDFL